MKSLYVFRVGPPFEEIEVEVASEVSLSRPPSVRALEKRCTQRDDHRTQREWIASTASIPDRELALAGDDHCF